jgi:hypothetical protein
LLDHGVVERDLAVAGHHRSAAVADRQDRCGVKHPVVDYMGQVHSGADTAALRKPLILADF